MGWFMLHNFVALNSREIVGFLQSYVKLLYFRFANPATVNCNWFYAVSSCHTECLELLFGYGRVECWNIATSFCTTFTTSRIWCILVYYFCKHHPVRQLRLMKTLPISSLWVWKQLVSVILLLWYFVFPISKLYFIRLWYILLLASAILFD